MESLIGYGMKLDQVERQEKLGVKNIVMERKASDGGLLSNLHLPTRGPSRHFVKVCHPLLTQKVDMMQKADSQDGLVIGSRGPI